MAVGSGAGRRGSGGVGQPTMMATYNSIEEVRVSGRMRPEHEMISCVSTTLTVGAWPLRFSLDSPPHSPAHHKGRTRWTRTHDTQTGGQAIGREARHDDPSTTIAQFERKHHDRQTFIVPLSAHRREAAVCCECVNVRECARRGCVLPPAPPCLLTGCDCLFVFPPSFVFMRSPGGSPQTPRRDVQTL